jgi:hypothetical protein
MTLAKKEIGCSAMKPTRGQASMLARGWTVLARLLVQMQPPLHAEENISKRYESHRWCDSTERQLNNAIMFGRPARF